MGDEIKVEEDESQIPTPRNPATGSIEDNQKTAQEL